MKLLLISQEIKPHIITKEHVKHIREAVPDLEIVRLNASQEDEIRRHSKDADVLAGWPIQISSMSDVAKLKWIHSFSAGVDRILTDEIKNSPVLVSNSSGIHAVPIAEHIMGFLLIFTRRFYRTFRTQQRHAWERLNDIEEIHGKTVLIAGLGDIGEETARLAHAFGAEVLAVDKDRKDRPNFVSELYGPEHLDELLSRADFVVICPPLTNATRHLFNKERFSKMKSSAVLVNIARGPIVEESELVEAIKSETIAGAALDVTEQEPLPENSPLWDMKNVVITPHHSGISEKYTDRAIDRLILNLKAFLAGDHPPNLVDKEQGY